MENQLPTLTKIFEAANLKNLQLQTWSGDIELIGNEEATIRIEVFLSIRSLLSFFFEREPVATFDPALYELQAEQIGNVLKINAKPNYFHPFTWFNFPKISFRVYLPQSIQSNVKTFGGKIFLKNLNGNHLFNTWGGPITLVDSHGHLQGKTMGGKIEVVKSGGNIHLKTMGGNLFLADNQGEINVNTMGGNILVQQHKGQVQASTWGGNINANDVYGGFECSTAGGNIRLYNMNGHVGASTKGGNITADMPTVEPYAWFDTAGGKIKVLLPLDKPLDLEITANKIYHPHFQNFEGHVSSRRIKGKLNGGGPHITIKTTGGKVTVGSTHLKSTSFVAPPHHSPLSENSLTSDNIRKEKSNLKHRKKATLPPKPTTYSFNESFFTFLFCLLLVYGLSSILFFSLETINPKSIFSTIYKGIFYSNITNGIGAFGAIYIYIRFVDHLIRFDIAKYATIIIITFINTAIFKVLLSIFYWQQVNTSAFGQDPNNNNIGYAFIPLLVSCLYLYYWQRTRHITRKISEQEYQLLNLEKLKTKAQLNALEARINPHFLYNSLNSIAGLVHQDPDKAEEMTIQLSKLFRYSTGRSDSHSHTVAEELEIVKAYLAIEQMRFGNRLDFTIDILPELMNIKIPRFLLQPIVENAIKHGISQLLENGKIEIKIEQKGDLVQFTIHDNGPAFKEEVGGGYGLRSIKDKLNLFYGEKAALQIQNNEYKAVCITLPTADELIEFR